MSKETLNIHVFHRICEKLREIRVFNKNNLLSYRNFIPLCIKSVQGAGCMPVLESSAAKPVEVQLNFIHKFALSFLETLINCLCRRIATLRGARNLNIFLYMPRFLRYVRLALHPAQAINQRFLCIWRVKFHAPVMNNYSLL